MKIYLKYLIYVMILLISSCFQREKGSQNMLSQNQAIILNQSIQRYGSVIMVKPEKFIEYKELHAHPWPEINQMISECNIRNYSIYYKDGYLFSYFEYVGDDFKADMQKMAEDSLTREWWKLTDPCQVPLESRKEGEWWASMEELYHLE